jgi:hypothetical protein
MVAGSISVHGIHPGANDELERVQVGVPGPVDQRPVDRGSDARIPPGAFDHLMPPGLRWFTVTVRRRRFATIGRPALPFATLGGMPPAAAPIP